MPLRILDLHDCESITDVTALKGMPARELDLRKAQVRI